MNSFKFDDCIDCLNVGGGITRSPCSSCDAGQSFEERIKDTVEEMMLRQSEREEQWGRVR